MRHGVLVLACLSIAVVTAAITDPPSTRDQDDGVPFERQCEVCEELIRFLSEDLLMHKHHEPGVGADPLTTEAVDEFFSQALQDFARSYRFSLEEGLREAESTEGDRALAIFTEHMRYDTSSLAALLAFRHAFHEAGEEFLEIAEAMVCQHSLNLCAIEFMPKDGAQGKLMDAYFRAMDHTSGLHLDDL